MKFGCSLRNGTEGAAVQMDASKTRALSGFPGFLALVGVEGARTRHHYPSEHKE
jgi:hypothetical protein